MTEERKVCCGVAVILLNSDGYILMGKRKGSHGAGTWSFPGGWLRHGESFLDAAKREVAEETGIQLNDAHVADTMSTVFQEADVHSVTILMVADQWTGEPVVKEPEKLDGDWQWCGPPLPEPLFAPLLISKVIRESFSVGMPDVKERVTPELVAKMKTQFVPKTEAEMKEKLSSEEFDRLNTKFIKPIKGDT